MRKHHSRFADACPILARFARFLSTDSNHHSPPIPAFSVLPPLDLSIPNTPDPELVSSVAGFYKSRLISLLSKNERAFDVTHVEEVSNKSVHYGVPLHLGNYDTIPLWVSTKGERAYLVFAYRSKSQQCWRRFAGLMLDQFYKGTSEHVQNFDWRIQRTLDRIYSNHSLVPLVDADGRLLNLEDLSITKDQPEGDGRRIWQADASRYLVLLAESILSDPVSRIELASPDYLLAYWWSGTDAEPYGLHVNLITTVASNPSYIYCIALTEEGIFLKYLQQNNGALGVAGSPKKSVLPVDVQKQLLMPLFEYAEQVSYGVEIERTAGFGPNRVRVFGIHGDGTSPLFKLGNGLADLCRFLRSGGHEFVDLRLKQMVGGPLPLADAPYLRINDSEYATQITKRHIELLTAFETFMLHGSLNPAELQTLSIAPRDLALFNRYSLLLYKSQNQERLMGILSVRLYRHAAISIEDHQLRETFVLP